MSLKEESYSSEPGVRGDTAKLDPDPRAPDQAVNMDAVKDKLVRRWRHKCRAPSCKGCCITCANTTLLLFNFSFLVSAYSSLTSIVMECLV